MHQLADKYTGGLNNNVFKFLDEITIPDGFMVGPDGLLTNNQVKQIEYKRPAEKEFAKDVLAHIQGVLSFAGTCKNPESLKAKRQYERESYEELHKKYPNAGFDTLLRNEKRFREPVVDRKTLSTGETNI